MSKHGIQPAGFTYISVLILVAILGITMAAAGSVWYTYAQREKEKELLFVGDQFRRAIGQYYERSSGSKQFPKSIDDLLLDRRFPHVQRYLRRPYLDPMTGQNEWGIVSGPNGGIVGVYSLSEEKPFKQDNFKDRDAAFAGAQRYVDWKFSYRPLNP